MTPGCLPPSFPLVIIIIIIIVISVAFPPLGETYGSLRKPRNNFPSPFTVDVPAPGPYFRLDDKLESGAERRVAELAPQNFMPTEVFHASRWTKGNLLFPTIIEVSDKAVTRRKRSWFSQDEMSMTISKVASVHIKTGMVWSDILIESSGGSDPMSSHGHTKADAQRIKDLVEDAQAAIAHHPPEQD